jgi:hypothetical protein
VPRWPLERRELRARPVLPRDRERSSSSWPDIAALAVARAETEIPRWGGASLQFRDAANPNAEPIFVLNDKDEVHQWEYLEGVCRHLDRLLRVASEAVSRSMRDVTGV